MKNAQQKCCAFFIDRTAENISYIYDAIGAKLKKNANEVSSLGWSIKKYPVGVFSEQASWREEKYTVNYIYKNETLEFFNQQKL